jgi:hypothetical protein
MIIVIGNCTIYLNFNIKKENRVSKKVKIFIILLVLHGIVTLNINRR